jgi:hypothetical protein
MGLISVKIEAVDPNDKDAVRFADQLRSELMAKYAGRIRPEPKTKTLALDDEPHTHFIAENPRSGWDKVIAEHAAR